MENENETNDNEFGLPNAEEIKARMKKAFNLNFDFDFGI